MLAVEIVFPVRNSPNHQVWLDGVARYNNMHVANSGQLSPWEPASAAAESRASFPLGLD